MTRHSSSHAAVRALEQKVSNLGKATNSANQAQPTNRPAATLTGILTDAQFRAVLRALEQRSGVDVLSMPSVTTLSGRQALVEVSESKTVVYFPVGDDVRSLIFGGSETRYLVSIQSRWRL